MAITQAFCNSFKPELFQGTHVIKATAGDTIKMALYIAASATLSASTTVYTTTGESTNITGTAYTAGGNTLTVTADPTLSGSAGVFTFNSTTWGPNATFNSDGVLIYNSSKANRAMGVFSFASAQNPVNGSLTVNFPAATFQIS